MTESEGTKAIFALPLVANPPYKQNLIKSTICELRFPILTSIGSKEIPEEFSEALRKGYPYREPGFVFAAGQKEAEPAHVFKSRDRHWTVSLRPAAFSLETDAYKSFEDFEHKLMGLAKLLVPLLDTDFFTRVGLRYINVLPTQRGKVNGWLNPKLDGFMMASKLGFMDRAWAEVVGRTAVGQYSLRWGFPSERTQDLVLDTDFYSEDVDAADLSELLPKLHDLSFALFHWCIDKKAISFMQGGQ